MTQVMEMTNSDSDFCTFYKFPSKAYPRFRFFQDNLISFYPRFQRTFENLPVCLKWKDLMEDLSKKVKPLEQSKPEVILFGEKHNMIKAEQIVANINRLTEDEHKGSTFSRKDLPRHVSVDTPQVLVYRSSSDKVVQESVLLLEKELTKAKTDNVLLLIDVGEQSENEGQVLQEKIITSLNDIIRDFWKDKMIVMTVDQSMSTKISNHLEICIVKEFERIEDCIREILSVQRKMASSPTFERNLISKVNQFLQSKEVVQDLMALAGQGEGRDLFLQEQVNLFLQEQVMFLIQREVSDDFHTQFKMAVGDIHDMLEEIKFKEECKTKFSTTTWRRIQSQLWEAYKESQQNEKPMKTDQETGKKTKEHIPKSGKPQPQQIHSSDQIPKILMKELQPVLEKVEIYLQGVQGRLNTLSQLQFELNGILKNTTFSSEIKRERVKEVPNKTDTLEKWTKKLLELPEVQGCGDYFGTLLIFISKENSIEKEVKKKIARCLSGCPYDYDITYKTNPKKFANPNPNPGGAGRQADSCIKAGDKIRWVDTSGNVQHGTLGMFVQGNKDPSVYLVTNGHVVTGQGICYTCVQDKSYKELGTVKWETSDGYIDIAAVKVNSDMCDSCILHYENYYGEQCSYVILNTSEDMLESLVGNKVFKKGAETGLTEGIISSKSIQMKEGNIIKSYNTLISALPGCKPKEAQFAKEGDSGSVVSLHTADETTVEIMGMLIGEFEARQTQEVEVGKHYLAFYLMDGLYKLISMYGLDMKVETSCAGPMCLSSTLT